jgi:error-prone DNA polymerase
VEGGVVHLIARYYDLSDALAGIGDMDVPFPFPHRRGDEGHHGQGTDARSAPKGGVKPRDICIPDLPLAALRLKFRNFR